GQRQVVPSLGARRKVRRQGSKFIECYRDQHVPPVPRALRALKSLFVADRAQDDNSAFRIYAFKNGAWPEMILGAVMGAASRIEAERRRSQPVTAPREEPNTPETEDFYEGLAREESRRASRTKTTHKQEAEIELPGLDVAEMPAKGARNGAFAYRPAESPTLEGSQPLGHHASVNGRAPSRSSGRYSSQFGSYANQAQA